VNNKLWQMPVPATAIIRGPFLKVLLKRQYEISFSIEADNGGEKPIVILFKEVQAFKSTYLASLGSVDKELFREAYGSLISLEESAWFNEIKKAYIEYHAKMPAPPKELHHLMICFDDGPCFELIAESWTVL
jgi:hypothetical protein